MEQNNGIQDLGFIVIHNNNIRCTCVYLPESPHSPKKLSALIQIEFKVL